ncbi:MAG: hypothetical protein WBB25_00285 [Sulfitobacter sp.]
MQFVATTPIALLICAAILYVGPVRGTVFLFMTMPFGISAAVNLRGLGSITLTDAAVTALWLSMFLHRFRLASVFGTFKPGQPGLPLLLLMLVVTFGAFFLPRINAGVTEVFIIARRDGAAEILLAPLGPVGSNIGQLFRLTMSASIFVVMATVFRRSGNSDTVFRALLWATIIHILLSLADLSSTVVGQDPLAFLRTGFVNVLDNQYLSGIRRLIGAFAEPSSFAYYTMGLFGFWLNYWFGARNSRVAAFMLLATILLLVRSTSSAAWLGMAAFGLLFLIWQVRTIARNQRAAVLYLCMTAAVPAVLGAAMLAYTFIPAIPELLDRLLFTKLSSSSGVERMSWNTQALRNFFETGGMGAGLGSVRGSGWLFVVMGSLGVVGTGLYLWFLGAVLFMRPANSAPPSHGILVAGSLQAGCAAILLQACLTKSYPNLETEFFAMAGLAVGLMRHLALSNSAVPGRHDPLSGLPLRGAI